MTFVGEGNRDAGERRLRAWNHRDTSWCDDDSCISAGPKRQLDNEGGALVRPATLRT
jgi:hypothetical protein